jgi:hypothetical protein
MKRFSLTEETLNKVLNYLATKPYVEVAAFVATIQKEAQALPEEATTPTLVETKEVTAAN